MRDIYAAIASRLRGGTKFAVGTLVATRNSSPAPIGTSLIVDAGGGFTGNIGAGCHEGEIVEAGHATIADGVHRTLELNMSDELLDGSACGAALLVEIWKPPADFAAIAERIVEGAERVTFVCAAHLVSLPPKRRLLIAGATDLAAHLTKMAQTADFHVSIVDPRPAFATRARQPDADRLIVAWPDDVLPSLLKTSDAAVVLSHDAKIDLPSLRCMLDSGVPYVGALGSRRSQRARREALRAAGYAEATLDRIHGPIGLDLGAVTNAQIACSIFAEILAVLNCRSGRPLNDPDEASASSSY